MTKVQEELARLMQSLNANFEDAKSKIKNEGRDERILNIPIGKTIVRVLPPMHGMIHPWTKKFLHMFDSAATGELISRDCPQTFKMPCKICQNNHALWTAGDKSSKDLAVKYKRKATYTANVYVKESKELADVGQVKVYRFGKKIYEKFINGLEIHGMFYAPDASGCDFAIVKQMKSIGGTQEMPNYDSSTFLAGTPLAKTPEEIMKIINMAYDLKEFDAVIDEEDPQLKNAFNMHVLGRTENVTVQVPSNFEKSTPAIDPNANLDEMPAWSQEPLKQAAKPAEESSAPVDDDDAAFLAELAREIES